MRRVRSLSLAALGLSVFGVAAGVGCGSTTTGTSGNDAGGKKDSSSEPEAGAGIVAPPAPTGPTTTSTTAQNFAIHQLFLGDTDNNGTATPMYMGDPNAWKAFGYNLDGKITTATSTNVCTLVNGGGENGPTVQVDGNGGIDNAFGAIIFDAFLTGTLYPTASSKVNSELDEGTFTLMFDITGLTSSPTQTATGLSAEAFAGGDYPGGNPAFDSNTNWPVIGGSLLASTSPIKSAITFSDSYVVNGTWVSGAPTTINLSLSIDGFNLALPIEQAQITFEHSTPAHAANGIIAGIIPAAQLLKSISAIAGKFEASLCNSKTLDSILAPVIDSPDIVVGGPNNAGTTCDGISIGLGFTADEIAQPTTIAPATTGTPPCTDAGVVETGPVDSGSTDGPTGG